ncbi:MAG: cation:proton antiporter, partial [Bdellovibrionaceae bacterium]|nr:cation:proton antiporter [Pseudobdellovibrionaceae bacterium]
MAFPHIFAEVGLILILVTVLGFLASLLKQPMVVAFIISGILVGPDFLNIARSIDSLTLLSEISVAVLLFLVGLKLDTEMVNKLGRVAVATGLGQVIFTSLIGIFVCLLLGMDWVTSIYVSVSLTFSSTIIIVKLLSDKKEVDSLHGKIAIGFLIVQDLIVVLSMVVISLLNFQRDLHFGVGLDWARFILSLFLFFVVMVAFVRYLANPILKFVSVSSELTVVFAVTWAVGLSMLGEWLGIGKEVGGLIAGVTLAGTPVREVVGARLAPLRDFLLVFFFVSLGLGIKLDISWSQWKPALILSLFVLIGNPLIVLAIMGFMGYRRRTAFLAGLTVAQISEFSLIFIGMGIKLGHVDETALSLVTLVGLITITLSVYMISWSHHLYDWLNPYLKMFERSHPFREPQEKEQKDPVDGWGDILIIGLGKYGSQVAEQLRAKGLQPVGVDFNPESVEEYRKNNAGKAILADASDPEFLSHLSSHPFRAIVVALSADPAVLQESDTPAVIIKTFRSLGFEGKIFVRCDEKKLGAEYMALGADYVLSPFSDAARAAVDFMER